jgi:threonylcarbamoyladenosine tRNA methylthiotransferase MtaB
MVPNQKVAFYTLGCKLNFSESSYIAKEFEKSGYARVNLEDRPDVFVINTCSVTENADKKCQRLIRQAQAVSPDVFIAVIGCYAQLKPKEIATIPGVDLVLGAAEKFDLPSYVEEQRKQQTVEAVVYHSPIKEARTFSPSFSSGDRTRSFLKVQDGCDYFCSFCTIPLARGRSRSNSIAETIKVAEQVAQTDAKEVVLTGVNIGDFGNGRTENFFDLVNALEKVKGIARYRISSIEPNLLSNEIIEHVGKSSKFAPHFHIPLQSGSDHLLKKMRRRYDTNLFADRVKLIKEKMPWACIGVDVIVGYPGETEDEFLKTYNFLHTLDISYLHVFTYSERNNTTAIRESDVVPVNVRKERNTMLRSLSEKKKRSFYEQQRNATLTVLFEQVEEAGEIYGFTENYLRVKVPAAKAGINQLHQVRIDHITSDCIANATVLTAVNTNHSSLNVIEA